MKITLLGTGAGEGIPAFLCNCGICSLAREKKGKYVRQNSAAYIESISGESILLDIPPQIMMAFDRFHLEYNNLLSVFITHFHSDHTYGLKYLLEANSDNGYQNPTFVDLFLPADVYQMLLEMKYPDQPVVYERNTNQFYSMKKVKVNEAISVGPFKVLSLETNHINIHWKPGKAMVESFGYLITDADRKKIAYLIDSPVQLPEQTYEILAQQELDCLVFDCTFEKTCFPSGHSDIQGIIDMHQKLRPRRTIASHISHRNLGFESLKKVLGEYGIEVAYDGMVIIV